MCEFSSKKHLPKKVKELKCGQVYFVDTKRGGRLSWHVLYINKQDYA